jgi:AcrR family transcriptional regulator
MSSLRKKISVAAQEVYLREGARGFSMRKVARAVGVSAPAIYGHFRNKEELLNEIVIEGLRILEDYLKPALQAETPYARLVQMTERFLDFAMEQPKYFDFAFLIPSPDISRFSEEISRPDWSTFRFAVEQVAACIEDGSLARDDPLYTAITIWAEVHGLVTLYRTGRFGPDAALFRQIYRQSVSRLLQGLQTSAPA